MYRIYAIASWQRRGGFEKSLSAWGLARFTSHERVRAAADWAQSARALSCRHVPLRLAQLKDSLLAQVALALEQTLRQWCQRVPSAQGMLVGPTTMGKTWDRLGLIQKKTRSASE